MASIYKRGDIWYSYVCVNGHRIRKALGPSKISAEAKLAELIGYRQHIKYGIKQKLSWEEFRRKYLEDYSKGKSASTHKVDLRAINEFEAAISPMRTEDLSPQNLEKWKTQRKSAGYRPGGINRHLNALKAMRAKAVEWGYLQSSHVKVRSIKETLKPPHYFTKEQFARLLDNCRGQWHTAAMIGAYSGMRPAEIYHLSWQDVDFKNVQLRVTPKPGWEPKDYECRSIPLAGALAAHLKTLPKKEWVIDPRPDYATFLAQFANIVKASGLRGGLRTCRHTFASWLTQAGVQIFVVSKLLGHASLEHTMRYAALCDRNLEEAVKFLPEIPNSATNLPLKS